MKICYLLFFWICCVHAVSAATDTIPTPFSIKIDLAPESKNWREYNSYDGRFSILTPGDMKQTVDSVNTSIGTLAYHTFFYQTTEKNADNVVYMLSYCDYPNGSVQSDSTELLKDFFDATIDAAVKSVHGELMYQTDTQYQHYPGKIWRIDYLDGKAVIKTKAYVIGQRFYTIQTISRSDRSINISTDKFLDSFKLIE